MKVISEFQGEHSWLSNFIGGVEQRYQSAKCLLREDADKVLMMMPGEAKRYVKGVPHRPDWLEVNLGIMEELVLEKFSKEPYRTRLLNTGDAILEEGNRWHDTFWGICPPMIGVGQNQLGKIIMAVREKLKMVTITRSQLHHPHLPGINAGGVLDITVKSARGQASKLAPTWSLVSQYKSGKISARQYCDVYIAQLSKLSEEGYFEKLAKWAEPHGKLELCCYCKDGEFCHTYIVADYICAHYPELFVWAGDQAGINKVIAAYAA
jgi:predicted NAD-dependent protein-ADP-ribosyltransferase YbiA (DUF1768 family)